MSIIIGFEWNAVIRVEGSPPAFPSGCALAGQARVGEVTGRVLATLTTANGRIVRNTDEEVTITIPAVDTATLSECIVLIDLARTDITPPAHFGAIIRVPARRPPLDLEDLP